MSRDKAEQLLAGHRAQRPRGAEEEGRRAEEAAARREGLVTWPRPGRFALLGAAFLPLFLAGPLRRRAGGARGPRHRRQPAARLRRRRPADVRLLRPRRRREPPGPRAAAAEEPRRRRRAGHARRRSASSTASCRVRRASPTSSGPSGPGTGRGRRDDLQARRQGREGRCLPPRGRDGAQAARGRPRHGALRRRPVRARRSPGPASAAAGAESDFPAAEPVLAFIATPSKETAFVGEEVTITYELVTQAEVQGIEYVEAPQFPGLWAEDLERPERPQGRRDTWEGRPVARFTLLKKAVSGLTPGSVTIPPAKIRIGVRAELNPFGDPFAMLRPRVLERETKPITLKILPIPGRPDFKGPVGQFGVTATVDRKSVPAGEAVTLKVRLAGSGNLRTATETPHLSIPGVKVYPPSSRPLPARGAAKGGTSAEWDFVLVPVRARDARRPARLLRGLRHRREEARREAERAGHPHRRGRRPGRGSGRRLARGGLRRRDARHDGGSEATTTLPGVPPAPTPAPLGARARADDGRRPALGAPRAPWRPRRRLAGPRGPLRRRARSLGPAGTPSSSRSPARRRSARRRASSGRSASTSPGATGASETAPVAALLDELADRGVAPALREELRQLLAQVDFLRFAPQLGDYGDEIARLREKARDVLGRVRGARARLESDRDRPLEGPPAGEARPLHGAPPPPRRDERDGPRAVPRHAREEGARLRPGRVGRPSPGRSRRQGGRPFPERADRRRHRRRLPRDGRRHEGPARRRDRGVHLRARRADGRERDQGGARPLARGRRRVRVAGEERPRGPRRHRVARLRLAHPRQPARRRASTRGTSGSWRSSATRSPSPSRTSSTSGAPARWPGATRSPRSTTTATSTRSSSRRSTASPGGADGDLTLLFLDCDHLKSVNDEHGHLAGKPDPPGGRVRPAAAARRHDLAPLPLRRRRVHRHPPRLRPLRRGSRSPSGSAAPSRSGPSSRCRSGPGSRP